MIIAQSGEHAKNPLLWCNESTDLNDEREVDDKDAASKGRTSVQGLDPDLGIFNLNRV